jgi:hypothetical protein
MARDPAQLAKRLHERCKARLSFRIVCREVQKHANPPQALGLLRVRRERPRRGRAAEKRDELATTAYSITS